MSNQKSKTVKLQAKYRALTWGQKIVPELRINGIWLEEHGFKVGDVVEITTRERLLIIQPVRQDQEEISSYKKQLREMKGHLKKLL